MLRVRPFTAIRPVPHLAPRVASLPYDVVTAEEARAQAANNPVSFLHVVRAEIDLPVDTSPCDERVYARARENLDRMLRDGVLVRESTPRVFVYRQVLNHRPQAGVVCCCHLDDYVQGVIRRHERTRPDKEEDRTRHMLKLNAHPGPVFLTYRDDPGVARIMADDMNDRPLFHFNAPDGVTHTAWVAHRPQNYVDAFARLPVAYVADGHHRTAAAVRAREQRRAANPDHRGDEEYNWFLAVLFPAGDLTILPYNRVVNGLNGHTSDQVLDQLARVGDLKPSDRTCPDRPGVFCLYVDGRWHELALDPATIDRSDPVTSLDVDLLQSRVLGPILGIDDPTTSPQIDFVGGVRGPEALQRKVDGGEASIAFSLFPTAIDQLLAVADAGRFMPPKSTWFEPKLRSGLFVHSLD